jgi:hypothetical protein
MFLTKLHRKEMELTVSNDTKYEKKVPNVSVRLIVKSTPLISQMCKGAFTKRPPPRKVPSVWDPTPVLDIFMHWTLPLSYAQLVRKCAFILAIFSGRRLSELFGLKCNVNHL